ncbi:MAG: hypothetical protein RLZZ215_408 [Pseudomonadota bacterium]|jgi:hypothetical protein
MHRKNRTNYSKYSNFPELTQKRTREHTLAVGRNDQHTAKFWDSHPQRRRHTRHSNAGFFVPVSCVTSCGYLPGVRGLQHGISRNMRVVHLRDDENTRQFLPILRTYVGNQAMTATQSMGNSARYSFAYPSLMRPVAVGGAAC